jgi:hypothetical protein
MNKATKGAPQADQPPADRPGSRQGDLNTLGAMREPSQTPGQAAGPMEDVKKALQEQEEKEGDWSKGGG